MKEPLAVVNFSCGRYYLKVAGVVVAMEGDRCRDSNMPESVLEPIPAEELEQATIGGQPAKNMPLDVVRFFRGDNWNKAMLQWTADQINRKIAEEAEG